MGLQSYVSATLTAVSPARERDIRTTYKPQEYNPDVSEVGATCQD